MTEGELPMEESAMVKCLNERSRLAFALGKAEKEIERLKEYEFMYMSVSK